MLSNDDLRQIVDAGIAITNERDKNKLLEAILDTAMDISKSDAGTLYLYKEDKLYFAVMKTRSLNVNKGLDDTIEMPPVEMTEKNVCSYVALHRKLINIENVYETEDFDFAGPKKYDSITGYHTGSMLVLPMEDVEDKLIGVIQLINRCDDKGNVVAYSDDDELVLRSLGSQAAVALTNMIYLEEITTQMHSFVDAFATAVDERTPYNGNHTRKVRKYALQLAKYINKMHEMGNCSEYFDANRLEQLELAATLHDIGKMIVPLGVMNKATRLDGKIWEIEERFNYIKSCTLIEKLEGKISAKKCQETFDYLDESLEFIKEIDGIGFMSDENIERVIDISNHTFVDIEKKTRTYITELEKSKLCIRKGTLTDNERKIMESHVVMTEKILSKVRFNESYKNVPVFAAQHHECLDGSGYPRGIGKAELPMESRMLAVVDIYDALTSTDRPYKKPMPREKAFEILYDMADKGGKLDHDLVAFLEESFKEEKDEK